MAENARGGRIRRVDSPTHNNIACESCRTKKRRCDRSLPVCLQCANDPSSCHYPEENKRGLPSGYVNKLEARLAETEAALYQVLGQRQQQYDAHPVPAPALASAAPPGQNKADRVREWECFPLQSDLDVRAWYRWKAGGDDGPGASPAMTSASSVPSQVSHSVSADVHWPSETIHQEQEQQQQMWANDSPMSRDSQPAGASTTRSGGATYTVPGARSSKAKELSESKKTMYF
ncbi:hypothetical protein N3K66_000262 [Trichothecium roseum]|uniref:Uncharacterized protein n=1 Tax=Trichothecium roseum TaxID=47278 RepID=A0ACC0VC73_9HYPO|nr:hypothetical protein N3K66_000262 [Trichothecium roseum]